MECKVPAEVAGSVEISMRAFDFSDISDSDVDQHVRSFWSSATI